MKIKSLNIRIISHTKKRRLSLTQPPPLYRYIYRL